MIVMFVPTVYVEFDVDVAHLLLLPLLGLLQLHWFVVVVGKIVLFVGFLVYFSLANLQ